MIPVVTRLGAAFARAARSGLESLCGVGIVLGTLLFAASLTPTLIPRSFVTQGMLAGTCLALGYALGVLGRYLWRYLGLPEFSARVRSAGNGWIAAGCIATAVIFLWQAADGQNSIRAAMELAPVASAHPFELCAIALFTFSVLLLLGRVFGYAARRLAAFMRGFIPRRIANALGVLMVGLLCWSLASDVLFRGVVRALDASYRELDTLLEPKRPQPMDPGKTGSAASHLQWATLGRAGREFVASGPTSESIAAFTGRPAQEPVRVYVGLRGGDKVRDRARTALAELQRQGGFERAVLVVVTPTGTGWVDPAAMDTLEYLHDGDVASVAMQYSYLSSPLSLLVQPELGAESAQALFDAVYGYWTTLPRDARPQLYLHGLSLGAMNSEHSVDLLEIIDDPVAGALWAGPPFQSELWRSLVEGRNAGSPVWLPTYRDGRFVRFHNQSGSNTDSDAEWGTLRIVYLQYASDPIVFFSFRDAWRRPEWMEAPLGPGVSADLRWYPLVTMLQLALDMMMATSTPVGHGHVYAPEHYVDAWIAVTAPQGWSPDSVAALKRHLSFQRSH